MAIRALIRPRWMSLVAGLLIGLLVSSGLVYAWNRPYNQEPSLYLLGSGKGLSALFTVGKTRVLITGGNDPVAFSNALADARPLTAPRIDLMIITPGSEKTTSRSREITKPANMIEIASQNGDIVAPDAQQIHTETTIALGNQAEIIIAPGLIVGSAFSGWSISIRIGSNTLFLVERQPIRALSGMSLLAIMGHEPPLASLPATAPMAVSAPVAGGINDATWPIGLIAPGDMERIRIEQSSIRIPGSWE